jgi:hypothetical protein
LAIPGVPHTFGCLARAARALVGYVSKRTADTRRIAPDPTCPMRQIRAASTRRATFMRRAGARHGADVGRAERRLGARYLLLPASLSVMLSIGGVAQS